MSEFNIEVQGGSSVRLPTAGKYCDRDIIVTASGGGEEFIGVRLSDFSGRYNTPKVADARSIPYSAISDQNNVYSRYHSWFANWQATANGGLYVSLEEVYLPDNMYCFGSNMFINCWNLTTIHGDFSNVRMIAGGAFNGCKKLPQMPYCPNLKEIQNTAFQNCVALTEITLPDTLSTIATGAFNGCTNLTKINCLFAEGSVTGQPWGATNADVVYITEV